MSTSNQSNERQIDDAYHLSEASHEHEVRNSLLEFSSVNKILSIEIFLCFSIGFDNMLLQASVGLPNISPL